MQELAETSFVQQNRETFIGEIVLWNSQIFLIFSQAVLRNSTVSSHRR